MPACQVDRSWSPISHGFGAQKVGGALSKLGDVNVVAAIALARGKAGTDMLSLKKTITVALDGVGHVTGVLDAHASVSTTGWEGQYRARNHQNLLTTSSSNVVNKHFEAVNMQDETSIMLKVLISLPPSCSPVNNQSTAKASCLSLMI